MAFKDRVYFVIDMKSFFASVECSLRGLDPFKASLVVADSSRGKGSICLAVSPKMKALGVPNRCRLYEIPSNIKYIIAKPRMKKYIEFASNIYAIYLKYIDKSDIHVYSIDESFLDVTAYLKLYNIGAKAFAKKLMDEINNALHIPSSTGIGTNMFLAKIALDITAKHSQDRIGVLDEETFKQQLWHHRPITDFWSISTGTEKRLERLGIYTMYDIAHFKQDILYREFGINAELLIDHAWGRESCTISDIKNYKRKSQSLSTSQILPKDYPYDDALNCLKEMVQNLCYEMYKSGYVTNLLHITVGYTKNEEPPAKGTVRMSEVTNLYSIIEPYIDRLYRQKVSRAHLIRKIGIDFCDIKTKEEEQYNLFTDLKKVKKEKAIVGAVLNLQEKFGKNIILKGNDLLENATTKNRNTLIGGHNSE